MLIRQSKPPRRYRADEWPFWRSCIVAVSTPPVLERVGLAYVVACQNYDAADGAWQQLPGSPHTRQAFKDAVIVLEELRCRLEPLLQNNPGFHRFGDRVLAMGYGSRGAYLINRPAFSTLRRQS